MDLNELYWQAIQTMKEILCATKEAEWQRIIALFDFNPDQLLKGIEYEFSNIKSEDVKTGGNSTEDKVFGAKLKLLHNRVKKDFRDESKESYRNSAVFNYPENLYKFSSDVVTKNTWKYLYLYYKEIIIQSMLNQI